jgi:hypothetical protein
VKFHREIYSVDFGTGELIRHLEDRVVFDSVYNKEKGTIFITSIIGPRGTDGAGRCV